MKAALDPQAIIEAVSRRMSVPVAVIMNTSRGSAKTANARHLAAWLMRHGLSMTFTEIATALRRRDHGSAMNSVETVEAWRGQDATIHLITNQLLTAVRGD